MLNSNLTEKSLYEAIAEIMKYLGSGAEFDDTLPIHSAPLMPIQDLAAEISSFLQTVPPVNDIEETDRDASIDAVTYLLDVLNDLGCDDTDIVQLAYMLEKIAMIEPTFRFQILHPKEIRVHIHPSDEREISLGSALGRIIGKQEEAADENRADEIAGKAAAYDQLVRLYREHVQEVLDAKKAGE